MRNIGKTLPLVEHVLSLLRLEYSSRSCSSFLFALAKILCKKCDRMLNLDDLMVEGDYFHHASYTSLVASTNLGYELHKCITDHKWLWGGVDLDEVYDQDLLREDTQMWCYSFDRKVNVCGSGQITIGQHGRFKRKYALDNKVPNLFVSLRLSTAPSMHLPLSPQYSTSLIAHR